MGLSTYTELQATIADTLNRSDLTTQIVDFITLLENELDRHPAVEFEKTANLTLTASPHVLPSDLRELTSLYYDDSVRKGPIDLTSPERLAVYKRQLGLTGYPRYAAVTVNGTELLLSPEPDQSYVVKSQYITQLDRLGGSTPSNWVLDDHSDLYLYGSLLHSAPFLKDDNRAPMWKAFKDEGLAQLDSLVRRRKWSANTATTRPPRAIG